MTIEERVTALERQMAATWTLLICLGLGAAAVAARVAL